MKQVILMRTDLGMKKGKMCAQAAHAAMEVARRISDNHSWYFEGMPKIVLRINSEEELIMLMSQAEAKGLLHGTIMDASLQELTCGAIGPADDGIIDEITKELKLL